MNNIYKVIWSKAKNCYVVASEIAKSHTKSASGQSVRRSALSSLLALSLLCGGLGVAEASVHVEESGVTYEVYTTGETYSKETANAKLDLKADKTDVATNTANIANLENNKLSKADASNTYATKADVNTELANKADKTYVDTELTKKADVTALGEYAKTADVNTELANKADKTYVDTELTKKADVTALGEYAKTADVNTELANKADKTYVDTELTKKADVTALGEYAKTADVNTELANKADKTYVDTELAKKADQADLDTANGKITDLQNKTVKLSADGTELKGMTTVETDALKVTGGISNGTGVTTTLTDINNSMTQTAKNKDDITNLKTKTDGQQTAINGLNEKTTQISYDPAEGTTTVHGVKFKDTEVDANGKGLTGVSTLHTTGAATIGGALTAAGLDAGTGDIKGGSLSVTGEVKGNRVDAGAGEIKTTGVVNAGTLSTAGNATVGGELNATGKVSGNGLDAKTGDIKGGNLSVTGAVKGSSVDAGSGEIKTTGAVNAGTLSTAGNATVGGDLSAKNTEINGTLTAKGEAKFEKDVTMDKKLTVTGDTSLGKTDVGGALNVTGESNLQGNVILGKNTANTVTVNGKSEFKEAVEMDNGLTVTSGDTTLKGKLTVTDDAELKNTTVGGALNVTGESNLKNTTVDGTLTAKGEATFKDKVTMEKNLEVKGTLNTKDVTAETIKVSKSEDTPDYRSEGSIIGEGGKLSVSNKKTYVSPNITKESELNVNEEGTVNWATSKDNATGNVTEGRSEVKADNIKNYVKKTEGGTTFGYEENITETGKVGTATDKDGNTNELTQTATGTENTVTSKDSNKSTTKQEAGSISSTVYDKDGNIKASSEMKEDGSISNNATGDMTNTVGGKLETTVTGQATENFNGGLNTTVEGAENHTVNGKQINTVTEGQINNITGGQINNITGDQTTEVTGKVTETYKAGQETNVTGDKKTTVTGKTTEEYKGGLETTVTGDEKHNVTGNQTNTITGDQTTTVTGDISNKAKNITNEATEKLTDKVGTNTRVTTSTSITDTVGTTTNRKIEDGKITDTAGDFTVTTDKTNGTTFAKTGSTAAYSTEAGAPTDTNIAGNLIKTGRVEANELKVSDKDDHGNTADLSVKAGEGVKASAGNGTTKGSLDVTADEVGSSVTDGTGKGSTFKQRIDAIMGKVKNNITGEESSHKQTSDVITDNVKNNTTGDQSFHKQTSDVIMDNVKDRDNSNNRTQTKTETKDIITDKDRNSSTTSQTASENKTYLKDKDGKNTNSTIDTAKGYDKTIKGENGETSTKQDELNITNTAKDGTITNDAKDIVNNASNSITEKVGDNTRVITSTSITDTVGTANRKIEDGKITDTAGDSTVTTVHGKGTTFTKKGSTAYREGGPTDTNISGNTITTGKVTMDYADVMKDLGVHGNATVDKDMTVKGNTTLGEAGKATTLTVNSKATFNEIATFENGAEVKNGLTVSSGGLNVTGESTFNDKVTMKNGLDVTGGVASDSFTVKGTDIKIDSSGINAGGTVISNVADGSISEGSKDAVNGGQLYQVKNDLEGKVNKVGANAAAMANLHPMEFDPDSKWNIAAAIGNYGSETAAALGAFYRPNDDVMVNLSTAFGTGENMVGGGVSVRLGKGSNKLSREESNALKDQVNDLTARMDALLSVLNPNMSKDFPDVPENHWAYEAVSRLAGNDIVQGYPDGEFHGDRTMTRYEMAEIIYNALSRGAEAERELVEEFKPELQAMAASEKATAEKAEG